MKMSVEERHGSVLDSDAQTLVNTVNTVGVMGKGLALEFKKRYPKMFDRYHLLCESGELRVGKLHLYPEGDRLILNFPTKSDFRRPSRLEYIERGLRTFVKNYRKMNITSIAFPRLGCGLGGLDWESQVRPIMQEYLQDLDLPIYVYDGTAVEGQQLQEPVAKAANRGSSWRTADEAWHDLRLVLNQMSEHGVRIDLFTWVVPHQDGVEVRSGELGRCSIEKTGFTAVWQFLAARNKKTFTAVEIQAVAGFSNAEDARAMLLVLEVLPYVKANSYRGIKAKPAKPRSYSYLREAQRPSPELREMLV